ncbi:glycine betaine ABC transporter substrate-binding protein [Marinobacter sp. X15-166B]|uniref:glycine betaine ABC transporter substrate-binding protein n=1 Tax=Marinobacter sp. X15-166B TaxID=1897620 RepID=UPI00085C5931|nr:glycine betaine ABC transporter substrate-binding protein [Marinobacter sp. X15-166B]OEY66999.1 glycine/betaine ABC transporter substrate-binding protein [Marinobacter sp. X15-166B]
MKRLLTFLSGLILAGAIATTAQAEAVVVGGKGFTEQLIMASMTSQYLEGLGYEVNQRDGMGSAVLRRAQESGQIDLYWEYTGTALFVYRDVAEVLNPEESYKRIKALDADKNLVWLNPSRANNTYALAIREETVEETGITSLSDLAEAINAGTDLTFAVNAEFYARDDGWSPLQKTYDFRVSRRHVKRMESGLVYQALRNGDVDVGLVFATDGRIPAFNFHVLEDDQGFFPAYAMTPVVRQETLEKHPQLAEQMNALSALLDDQSMAALNASVDVERQPIEVVARNFLEDNGLL